MKIKRMRTKKQKMWYIADIIIIAFCLIVTNLKLYFNMELGIIGLFMYFLKVFKGQNIILRVIISLFLLILEMFSINFWILLIYLVIRFTRLKKIKQNSSYEVIENIDYYRNTFNNLTPAEISILFDLEIENKKDITATILSLYYKKIIDFQNEKIIVIGDDCNLKKTEREALETLKSGKTIVDTINWHNIAISEAIDDGYIQKGSKKKLNLIFSLLLIILGIAMIGQTLIKFSNYDENSFENFYKNYEQILVDYFGENYEELSSKEGNKIIVKNPDILTEFFTSSEIIIDTLVFIAGITLIGIVIRYQIVKIISHAFINANNLERTRKGKILTEQIGAMKNFIHDFGNFSDKTKEQIKLWDEFLIYAVILEENEKIINEICELKNVKIFF